MIIETFAGLVYLILLEPISHISMNSLNEAEMNVELTTNADGLQIMNNRSSTIGIYAIDRLFSTHTKWLPNCSDRRLIEAGEVKFVDYSRIIGYSSGNSIYVYYWDCPLGDPEVARNEISRTEILGL